MWLRDNYPDGAPDYEQWEAILDEHRDGAGGRDSPLADRSFSPDLQEY